MESTYLLRSFSGDITIIPISDVDTTENWKDSLAKIIAKNDSSIPHWEAVRIGLPSVMDGSVLFPYIIQPPTCLVEIYHTSQETIYDENKNSLMYYQFCISNTYHCCEKKSYTLYNFELYHRIANDDFILSKDINYRAPKIDRAFSSLVDVLDHFSMNDEIKEIVLSKWGKKWGKKRRMK